MPPRDAGEWAEDGGERRRRRTAQTAATSRPASPLCCAPCARDWAFVLRRSTATPRSCARRSRSGETACSPVTSRCSYAQTPAPAVPALSAPLFLRNAAVPHAPGTNAAALSRWHRRRRPRTRRAHFAARPVHVSGLAGFLVEVGERPRRGRARRSRVDESISGLALGQCGYAQPPASVVSALRAPAFQL